jgi:hypothetical protein
MLQAWRAQSKRNNRWQTKAKSEIKTINNSQFGEFARCFDVLRVENIDVLRATVACTLCAFPTAVEKAPHFVASSQDVLMSFG